MSFHQFLSILRGRWRIALGVFGVCTILSVALSLVLPRLYTASASVVVDAKPDPLAGAAYQVLADEMQTQTDIVTSQRVAERVAKSLRLDQDPAMKQVWQKSTGGRGDFIGWVAAVLLKSITVPPPRESNVINIAARWTDAKEAAKIANAFAQAYIDTNIELRVQPAKQYATWFDERSRALRADLEAKQKLLSDYQDQEGLVATDEHMDIEMARLAELSSQLAAIQGQLQDSQSREQQSSVDGDNYAMPDILQSTLISALKSELSQAEAKEQELSTQVGENHPDYQRVAAKVGSLRNRIALETNRVMTSLRDTTRVNMRREKAISAAIEEQKKRVVGLKHQRDHAAILLSDVATAQRNFDAVSQGLAQTSLESQTRQANVALLTRATEPAAPSSPRYLMNLALGLLFGIALGIAMVLWLEKLDQRVRTDAELTLLLGVPLLANISANRAKPPRTSQLVFGALASRALIARTAAAKALGHD